MRAIRIVGGGLAGLALGNGLRRAGVPATILEAGDYPRHRVCGEFICGRGTAVLQRLGLEDVLAGGCWHRTVRWSVAGKAGTIDFQLPERAAGLSRYRLDERLAGRFREAGGELVVNHRYRGDAGEGIVWCSGRKITKSEWMGLKLHCRGLRAEADLEMHLGKGMYVGISEVEDGQFNVCALVRRTVAAGGRREDILVKSLEQAGLEKLSGRLKEAEVDGASHAAVAGVRFAMRPTGGQVGPSLGDAYSVMPPFTGNGMSLALEAGEMAVGPLAAYARGELDWAAARKRIGKESRRRFRGRLAAAGWLHPWLGEPGRQRCLLALGKRGLLPMKLLYRITH